MNNENLVGKKFGHLTVLSLNNKHHFGNSWLCKCECGEEIILGTCYLIGTDTRRPSRSCGCKKNRQGGKSITNHRLYTTWKHMIYRCTKPNETGYERYGGKGVTVCSEWENSFDIFLYWALSNGYSDELTIDRIDSLKPYEPSNCRWATIFVQAANKCLSKNNKLGHKGVSPLGDKFRVHLMRNGIRKHIGTFEILREAVNARAYALNQYEQTGTF